MDHILSLAEPKGSENPLYGTGQNAPMPHAYSHIETFLPAIALLFF